MLGDELDEVVAHGQPGRFRGCSHARVEVGRNAEQVMHVVAAGQDGGGDVVIELGCRLSVARVLGQSRVDGAGDGIRVLRAGGPWHIRTLLQGTDWRIFAKVAYQSTIVHIPLPNVHAPTEGVDLGAVKAGGSATKTVSIDNSGEMAATMTFKSSDPQFEVPGGSITVAPKSKYELQLKFNPANAGSAQADITVASNDPDSPLQTFKIGANGADVGGPDADSKDGLPGAAPAADSGCGCKTAGTTTSTGGWAGIGLLALGITVAARRRRANPPTPAA